MHTRKGVWIDHHRAVVVSISEMGEKVAVVNSVDEKYVTPLTGMRERSPNGRRERPREDIREREYGNHLETYYEDVSALLRGAESIVLLGPGAAKHELRRRIEKDGFAGRVSGVKTVDRMTDRQIVACVKVYFMHGVPRMSYAMARV